MPYKIRKISATVSLFLILSFVLVVVPDVKVVNAETNTIVVPSDYYTIQEAIDAASEGDTVFVKSGTYVNQTLAITKPLSLVGENPETTIIYGENNIIWPSFSFAIHFGANDVQISGFTVVITSQVRGIFGSGNRTLIENNVIQGNGLGIGLWGNHNTITNNNLSSVMFHCHGSNNAITGNRIDGHGIELGGSFNTISGNYLTKSYIRVNGKSNIINSNILKDGGVRLNSGSLNVVFENNITSNGGTGIHIYTASNNLVRDNSIANNGYGISLSGRFYHAENNTFYRNTLINNSYNIRIEEPYYANCWDNDFEGNYWDNYNGSDADGDGIGDTPYIIDQNNTDRYPLMAPVKVFAAGTWEGTPFSVGVVSNSTVSDFSFNPESTLIRFNVDGETGTAGFCRVSIPKDLLNAEGNWIVLVDSTAVTSSVNEDTINSYIYFTYNHSTKTVEIIGTEAIPEFPSWIILPLLLTVTLLVTLYRKRLIKSPIHQSY